MKAIIKTTKIYSVFLILFSLSINSYSQFSYVDGEIAFDIRSVETTSCNIHLVKKYNLNELRLLSRNAEFTGDLNTSIIFYKEIYNRTNDMEDLFKLAYLNEQSRNYKTAMTIYFEILKQGGSKNIPAQFYYARLLKMNNQIDESLKNLKQFNQTYQGEYKIKYTALVQTEINACKMLQKTSIKNASIEVKRLSENINGIDTEFSPILLDDSTMLFGSTVTDKTSKYFGKRKLFKAIRINYAWVNQGIYNNPINETEQDLMQACISKDRQTIYFTKTKLTLKNNKVQEIFVIKNENGTWQKAKKLKGKINLFNYTSEHPTIAYSKKLKSEVMYFISDRPGGFGGLDVWYTIYDKAKEEFLEPINAGGKVNTVENEITPYYDSETKTLYFSSEGFPGYGGYDVFSVSGELNRWGKVNNVGAPLNSNVDDISFIPNLGNNGGFFVSNRGNGKGLEQSCCNDIFEYIDRDKISVTFYGKIDLISSLEDIKETNIIVYKIIDDAELFIKEVTTENYRYEISNLEINTNYKLIFNNHNCFSKNYLVSTPDLKNSELINLENIDLVEIPKKPIILENVYYAFDKYELTLESKKYLDTTLLLILKENEDINITLSSHTDNFGSHAYNKDLSSKRAQSIKKYLIINGIQENRIISIGYGESDPIATNENAEGRKNNRRTEFLINKNDIVIAENKP